MKTTAIIVNYNTPEIISRAVKSVCSHVDFVIVVDNSDTDNPAYNECERLEKEIGNLKLIQTHENIGHGPGLNLGIEAAETEYIIAMDSDAVLIMPGVIQEMKEAMKTGVYGAGLVVQVNDFGTTERNGKYDYLHPYFAIFRKHTAPFINHGAPWLKTMKEIKSKQTVINIPDIQVKAWHEHRRTRLIAGADWQKNWEPA